MTDAARPRILIAGIGNVLRGDDGFGPAVVQALLARGALPRGVHAVELGIGGIGLVHELMDGYDAVVIVDAVDRGGAPGAIHVLATDELRRRDEVLQMLFWLQGQGFGPEIAIGDVLRFLDDERAARVALGQLLEDGYVEAIADGLAVR